MIIYLIFGSIVLLYIGFSIGYNIFMHIWHPKKMSEDLEKYLTLNKELSDGIKKLNDIATKKDSWYLEQLKNVSFYLKHKHNDNYLIELLNSQGVNFEFVEEKETNFNIDEILDKISNNGIGSLTDDELNFLRRNNES